MSLNVVAHTLRFVIPGTSSSPTPPDVVDYIGLLPAGTSSVTAEATAVDPDARVDVSGLGGLVPGYNVMTIDVTAPAGNTATYKYFLVVANPTDTSLQTLKVDGKDVLGGSYISSPSTPINLDVSTLDVASDGALSVDVSAVASDMDGTTVTIAGNANLRVGQNTLSVTVADKSDAARNTVYTRTINVLNNDTGSVITVNEEEVTNGDGVEVDWGTLSVPVTVTPSDSNATVKVNGTSVGLVSGVARTSATGLTTGENTISVVVTAPNGEIDESLLTVTVLPNTDASAVITIDGIIAEDGDEVPLDFGSTDPDIEVYTADEDATYVVDGGSDLIPGENRVEIFVTAADGVTVQIFRLTLLVQLDNDTTAAIYVNGVERSEG
ncbi:MAG: hypothetical protein EB057_02255, partial [Microbacteriaceae bacterium]|nr:hypothetical protein [Microbacteriaceae bacterium]